MVIVSIFLPNVAGSIQIEEKQRQAVEIKFKNANKLSKRQTAREMWLVTGKRTSPQVTSFSIVDQRKRVYILLALLNRICLNHIHSQRDTIPY